MGTPYKGRSRVALVLIAAGNTDEAGWLDFGMNWPGMIELRRQFADYAFPEQHPRAKEDSWLNRCAFTG